MILFMFKPIRISRPTTVRPTETTCPWRLEVPQNDVCPQVYIQLLNYLVVKNQYQTLLIRKIDAFYYLKRTVPTKRRAIA